MNLKSIGVGLAWFLAYSLVTAAVVRPVAQKFNVPLLKDI